jgi:hypothetical protein
VKLSAITILNRLLFLLLLLLLLLTSYCPSSILLPPLLLLQCANCSSNAFVISHCACVVIQHGEMIGQDLTAWLSGSCLLLLLLLLLLL